MLHMHVHKLMHTFEVWRHIKNALSVNRCVKAYSIEEQACDISSRSDCKRRCLGLFRSASPKTKRRRRKRTTKLGGRGGALRHWRAVVNSPIVPRPTSQVAWPRPRVGPRLSVNYWGWGLIRPIYTRTPPDRVELFCLSCTVNSALTER